MFQKDEIKRYNAKTQWEEEEKEMRRLFQKGAELCYLERLLDVETKQKYYMSGTVCKILFALSRARFPFF